MIIPEGTRRTVYRKMRVGEHGGREVTAVIYNDKYGKELGKSYLYDMREFESMDKLMEYINAQARV